MSSRARVRAVLGMIAAAAAAMVLPVPTARADAFFTGLGDMPGGDVYSRAQGVSADGSVVVGTTRGADGDQAFRWTLQGGMQAIGAGTANAVSADGSVIVGGRDFGSGLEAYRWTASGGFSPLGVLPGGDHWSVALGVSGNGKVVVGNSDSGLHLPSLFNPETEATCFFEAFRWDAASGMQGLGAAGVGFLGDCYSFAAAASDDGKLIVGSSTAPGGSNGGRYRGFVWTNETGRVEITPGSEQEGYGVSPEGGIVVGGRPSGGWGGFAFSAKGTPPGPYTFHWLDLEILRLVDASFGGDLMVGTTERGWVPNNLASTALASSLIAPSGSSFRAPARSASKAPSEDWVPMHGPELAMTWAAEPRGAVIYRRGDAEAKNVEDLAHELGVSTEGWFLTAATAISYDGRTIVGWGINPAGNTEAWLLQTERPCAAPVPGDADLDCDVDVADVALTRRRLAHLEPGFGRPTIMGLSLRDAATDAFIKPVHDGDTWSLADHSCLAIHVAVDAQTSSVQFDWTPPASDEVQSHTDLNAPFCWRGDEGWLFPEEVPNCSCSNEMSSVGVHKLQITPCSVDVDLAQGETCIGNGGTQGDTTSITFTITP